MSSPNPAKLPSSLAPNRSMHCAASSLVTLLNLPHPLMSSLHFSGVAIQLLRIVKILIKRSTFNRSTFNRPLPEGYYGNAFVTPAVVSTVEMLCDRPLSYALELTKKSKKAAIEEYVHSAADLMATNERGASSLNRTLFIVSDLTKCGLSDVDYEWGKPLYFGLDGIYDIPGSCYYFPHTNSKGENGKVVLVYLLKEDMKRFEKELKYFTSTFEDEPIKLTVQSVCSRYLI
ncbi:hypothetical protein PIB30_057561 [Stylosanthes scabra]|uniref:Uncharacterized protein n=1 Tax=Stylosanthes scabra TaxID=79078 RepID=A0ABU6ZIF7_9FABA|nr:hypothetical protein [Stylosanthes scabra]